MNQKKLTEFIEKCIQEDIKDGDHTSICCISENKNGTASLISKQKAIVAGVELAKEVFHYYDENLKIEILKKDGEEIFIGDVILKVNGKIRSILAMERLVLNCMQRMSGIATKTKKIKNLIAESDVKMMHMQVTI